MKNKFLSAILLLSAAAVQFMVTAQNTNYGANWEKVREALGIDQNANQDVNYGSNWEEVKKSLGIDQDTQNVSASQAKNYGTNWEKVRQALGIDDQVSKDIVGQQAGSYETSLEKVKKALGVGEDVEQKLPSSKKTTIPHDLYMHNLNILGKSGKTASKEVYEKAETRDLFSRGDIVVVSDPLEQGEYLYGVVMGGVGFDPNLISVVVEYDQMEGPIMRNFPFENVRLAKS